jgi:hypothetical protein
MEPGSNGAAWTPERIERLREMYAAGETIDAIATALDITRGAVSGKAGRLGLFSLNRDAFHQRSERKLRVKKPPMPEPEPQPAPPTGGVHILALTLSTCRFPLWAHDAEPDMMHCGARTTGDGPYCATHARRCFSTQTQRDAGRRAAAEIIAGRR